MAQAEYDSAAIPPGVSAFHQRALDESAAGEIGGAIDAYEHALAQEPGFALGWGNLACLYSQRQAIDKAIQCIQRARSLAPNWLELQKHFAVAHSAYLMGLQYSDRISRSALVAAHHQWYEANGAHLLPQQHCATTPPPRGRKLRVGFVSPDLYSHPVGMLLYGPLQHLDRERFSLHFYSDTRVPDRLTAEFKQLADSWHEATQLSDEALAEAIRRAGIDILFDLAGHTRANRLRVFCMRPAPVQASWLGYFDTTGIPAIDYALTSHYLLPVTERKSYAEQALYFRHTYFSPVIPHFAPGNLEPTVHADAPITFGCFNNSRKINAHVVTTWATLLHAVPRSRLRLRWETFDETPERERIRSLFRANGVADERVELHGRITYDKLLESYREIDIALDPFPYSGGMSSCDALLMGVPIVSLYADRPAGRQTTSFLHQMGLPELVCHTTDAYIDLARWLANHRTDTSNMRRDIARRYREYVACAASAQSEFPVLLSQIANRHFPNHC